MNNSIVLDALSKLGLKAKDKVTGAEGIVDSVGFDLYGCVQLSINTGLDKEGKPRGGYWYDFKRIEFTNERVMESPEYFEITTGREIGAAEKSSRGI